MVLSCLCHKDFGLATNLQARSVVEKGNKILFSFFISFSKLNIMAELIKELKALKSKIYKSEEDLERIQELEFDIENVELELNY